MDKFCFELSPIIEKCRHLDLPEPDVVTCKCGRQERINGPEIECRFGFTKNKSFKPGIQKELFMKILEKLSKCPQLTKVNKDWDYVRRFYVTHNNTTLRTSISLWRCCDFMSTNCVEKKVENQLHFGPTYNSPGVARIAFAIEQKPDERQNFPFISNTSIVRLMLRKSFKYKCFEWVFSIVYSGTTRSEAEQKMKDDQDPNFEIEIEIDTLHPYFSENDNLYISRSMFLKIQDLMTLIPKA